ncbi:MAG: carboxypeptidase M32 [Solirubrobacterales bacterium]
MAGELDRLRERLGEIHDLSRAASLLGWDERTMMPPAGAESRASQLATLARVRHEMFSDDEVGRLLDAVRARVEAGEADADGEFPFTADLVRVVGRDWEKARRVPSELRAEMARASSVAENAWVEAKAASDFAALLPHLRENLELARRFADCYDGFPGFESTYDALLDEYEPEMRTAEMREVLAALRERLVPLVSDAPAQTPAGAGGEADEAAADSLHGDFPVEDQRELLSELISRMPFPDGSWRIDDTEHPFATSVGRADIRLTTRYQPDNLGMALFSGLHEAGHGLYEAGVDPALARTPLAKPRSLGLHESQSRLWENWVGRSRPYLEWLLPLLRERFPGALDDVDAERLHRGANRVERSLIRIEADELTYNLHILIRFELELELFECDLALTDLPEAWNARYRDYLGLEVPDDARGVLQDVHWAAGAFGYFPTYSLGNVIAGQLWEGAEAELGPLAESIGRGDLAPLGGWLREHVHRHGRRLGPAEVLERAGCGELSVEPLLAHLRAKAASLA